MKVIATESIYNGDSSNYEPENSGIEDDVLNNRDNDTHDIFPSARRWSKYNSQLDFVKFSFTSQNGLNPPNSAPSEVRHFHVFFTPELIKEFTKNAYEYARS